MGDPRQRREREGPENKFEEIMAENFTNVGKQKEFQIK